MRVFVVLMVVVAAVWVPAAAVAELPPGGTFSDDNGSPFEGWIEAVAAEGVANGIGGGMFGPGRSVTRAEMAAFLVRAVEAVPSAVSVSRFPDVSGWALGYVEAAADLGITVGYGDGTFRPDALVSRAEMAVFMVRALGLTEAAVSGVFSDVPASAWFAGAVEAIRAEGITLGCSTSPLAYCPHGAVTRGQMAAFIGRALDLEPITPPPLDEVGSRAWLDRADDVSGDQIHAFYVVPSDGEDRGFDTSGAIHQALFGFNDWLREQSGGAGLRVDTHGGHTDVTYVSLTKSLAELQVPEGQSGGSCTRPCPSAATIEKELLSLGFMQENKVNVVFFEGVAQWETPVCGYSVQPPYVPGRTAVMYLPDALGPCGLPWEVGDPADWSMGLNAGHEIFHALGAVCPTAADKDGSHTNTPGDFMNPGASAPLLLDPGRVDYWGDVPAGCVDLSQLTVIDPLPNAAVRPPGW